MLQGFYKSDGATFANHSVMLLPFVNHVNRRAVALVFVCMIPILFILATFSLLFPLSGSNPVQVEPDSPRSYFPSSKFHWGTGSSAWAFDVQRDGRDFSLTDEQCDAAFPGYFYEIDRAAAYRKRKVGLVTKEDIDTSWRSNEMIRAMIYDRQLFIIEAKWAEHGFDVGRALSLLAQINRAIVSCPACHIPDIEFSICVGDIAGRKNWAQGKPGRNAVWTLSRTDIDPEMWVMPDFGYWSWPLPVVGEYTEARREIAEIETSWDQKLPKAVWRGSIWSHPARQLLLNVTEGKMWSDVHDIEWQNSTHVLPGMEHLSLSMPEHCAYQYVIHTEGFSYSGRAKYLLNCHSVNIIHEPRWIEPHSHLLVPAGPHQNYIEVANDFSDLDAKMKTLISHPDNARRIADESARIFKDRYLTPAAQSCYWRRMFGVWKSVMGFEVELWEEVEEPTRPDTALSTPPPNHLLGEPPDYDQPPSNNKKPDYNQPPSNNQPPDYNQPDPQVNVEKLAAAIDELESLKDAPELEDMPDEKKKIGEKLEELRAKIATTMPDPAVPVAREVKKGKKKKRLRGVPWETFMLDGYQPQIDTP